MARQDDEHAHKFREAVGRMAAETRKNRYSKSTGTPKRIRLIHWDDDKPSLSDAIRASVAMIPGALIASLPFYFGMLILWLIDEGREITVNTIPKVIDALIFTVASAGFFITYALLVGFVETRWPSQEKVRFGNYGLVPKKTAYLFPFWLGVYIYVSALIFT